MDWVAAAMRIVRCVACRFESDGLPMTSSDTPAMNAPLTLKALCFSRHVETGDGEALSGCGRMRRLSNSLLENCPRLQRDNASPGAVSPRRYAPLPLPSPP